MRERPILFSGPMVLAILDGRKTQTRRVMKEQPTWFSESGWPLKNKMKSEYVGMGYSRGYHPPQVCQFGIPGDRLWVKETGSVSLDKQAWMYADFGGKLSPSATPGSGSWAREWKTCPSIFMPRWASRISLEITTVRVEPLQAISEADAAAEGVPPNWVGDLSGWSAEEHGYLGVVNRETVCEEGYYRTARCAFSEIWDSINGKRPGCAWKDNPWCWVVEFKKL